MESATRPSGRQHALLTTKPKRTVDYKIVLLGESSVGKSSILERLQNNTFDDNKSSTIGAAFISKKVVRETDLINLQIWDTAGQERFHNLTPLYYRNSNAALLVFDLTSLESFKKAEYWINELETYIGEVELDEPASNEGRGRDTMKIILVGNKVDLLNGEACPFEDQIKEFMNVHKSVVNYFKTSAKKNLEIIDLFEYITNSIDDTLFYDIDEENKSKKGIIDLNFSNATSNTASSCSC
ncbi:hypothetical protein PICMEDRAFT_17652 [Pichia membranifaciens NRRL Y-2026]|uniref:GTP-binding protein YPT52 n=1 Tax=Pichia membranifaciens NRRL Y-2026 TaxID=763406 RepID=A0A1E3NG99_9ASCO|nr:hypothetical protein PICMEDRAFT_17652 [Pichia membranifaciens NRRL Y-2026]ODQ45161.1 hypothetical protein PICMEDRAFT_17652 [Pichia membranifaciens NRRL Y-2026]